MATKRQKLIAARDRAQAAVDKEREELELANNFRRLQTMKGGFSKTRPSKMKQRPKSNNFNLERVEPRLPAKADPVPIVNKREQLSPEMAAREEAAKEHYKLMQTRIAPAYNKGPDIYVSDGMLDDYISGSTKRR